MEAAQNILVVKTVTGMGMACATAIDSLNISGIVGTIAGDDTIICIAKNNQYAVTAIESLKQEINQG
jgi:transcriptional regulator of arginine metabolism